MNIVTVSDVLAEIRQIEISGANKSIQAARAYYQTFNLPDLLTSFFFRQRMQNKGAVARQLNMSVSSLGRVLSGADISENLLFRIEHFFELEAVSGSISDEKRLSLYIKPWRKTDSNSVQRSIAIVSDHLQVIYDALKYSNQVGSEESSVSVLQKAQIVALLEAMLAELKGPIVNAKKTSRFISLLKRIIGKGMEKGVEKGVSDAMEGAISEGGKLVSELSEQVGFSSLDSFFS